MEFFKFIVKWLHLMSICTIVGSTLIMYVLVNVRQAVSDGADRDPFRESSRHLGLLLAIAWVIALSTGFMNYMTVSASGTAGSGYHMFAGMKMVLALMMCAVTIYMGHVKAKPEGGVNREPALVTLLVLGAIIVGLSGHLNMTRISDLAAKVPKPAPGAVVPQPAPVTQP